MSGWDWEVPLTDRTDGGGGEDGGGGRRREALGRREKKFGGREGESDYAQEMCFFFFSLAFPPPPVGSSLRPGYVGDAYFSSTPPLPPCSFSCTPPSPPQPFCLLSTSRLWHSWLSTGEDIITHSTCELFFLL